MISPTADSNPNRSRYSLLICGGLINLLMGVMYSWSILLAPLESLLGLPRAASSLVPALGLVCFTIGVFFCDRIARQVPLAILAPSVVVVAGAGHLLFFLMPSYASLLLGPGLIFGTAAGVGYGLSIAIAQTAQRGNGGWAIGFVVAAFAASGMAASALVAALGIAAHDIPAIFGFLAATYLGFSLVIWALLQRVPGAIGHRAESLVSPRQRFDIAFLSLAAAYLAFCYIGLTIVSHGAPVLKELGVSVTISALALFILNAGYLIGAMLGGPIAARYPSNAAPMGGLVVLILCLSALLMDVPTPLWLFSFLALGAGFGSTVSIFVTLLAALYGADQARRLFGWLNLGYGLAGLTAPSVTGQLYDFSGSYQLPLLVCGGLGLLGILALVTSRTASGPASRGRAERQISL